MRIGILYDLQTDPDDPRQAEFDPPAVLDALAGALRELGHEPVRLGGARELAADPRRLRGIDLVFNIAEGDAGRCREAWAPALLGLLGMPYTGAAPAALAVGLDKVTTKKLAAACGLRTPRWICHDRPGAPAQTPPFGYPAIVKPRYEGSGKGISEEAVVHDDAQLRAQLQRLWANGWGPAMVEEFIPHAELTVCLIGNDPVVAYPAIQRLIDPRSRLSCHVTRALHAEWEAPLELDETLDAQARHAALALFRALGCRDVARVDLRVDGRGEVYLLEINPLPSFDPEGSFGLLAESLGLRYADLLGRVLDAALRRVHAAAGSETLAR